MICEIRFSTDYDYQKYCSKECRRQAQDQKEYAKVCTQCGKDFKASRFRSCCSIKCTQAARFKNVEIQKVKAQVKKLPTHTSKVTGPTDPQLSTEKYFYSLVNTRNDVKLRKCLRCGTQFKTTPSRRTCAACSEINSRKRMRL